MPNDTAAGSNQENGILRAVIANISAASFKYTALACPFKYISVDPAQIQYHCPHSMQAKRENGSKLLDWGKVLEGDWDLARREPLKISHLADQLSPHFLEGVPWEETDLFQHRLQKILTRGKIDGCRNRQQLLERYQRMDMLWREVNESKSLKSADERGAGFDDDIFVTIGRDGGYMLSHGGSHRLAMAQLCGIETIPVRVVFRHPQWQLRRIAVMESREIDGPEHHPDFDDLLAPAATIDQAAIPEDADGQNEMSVSAPDHIEVLWISHYDKLKQYFYKHGSPLKVSDDGRTEIIAHPDFDQIVVEGVLTSDSMQSYNKSTQLYFYSGLWTLFVDFNDNESRNFCCNYIRYIAEQYEEELARPVKRRSMIHDDHGVSDRASVFVILLEKLKDDTELSALITRHLYDLHGHLKSLVSSDKWLLNNHRLFHLFSLIVLELRFIKDEAAARAATLKVEEFFDALIDRQTMLCREQSVYYMIFDIGLLNRFIPLLKALGLAGREYDLEALEQTYLRSLSVLAYPDGGLPAFGDTPLGLKQKIVFIPDQQYRRSCAQLDELGYHKIYNQHAQVIMLSHCSESSHGHHSPLHIDVWTKPYGLIFTDSGGPYYYGHALRGEYFRSPVGHNTVSFGASARTVTLDKISVDSNEERTRLESEFICADGALNRSVSLDDKKIHITDIVKSKKNWQLAWHFSDQLNIVENDDRFELRLTSTGSIIGTLKFSHDPEVRTTFKPGFLTYGYRKILVESQILEFSSNTETATIHLEIDLP